MLVNMSNDVFHNKKNIMKFRYINRLLCPFIIHAEMKIPILPFYFYTYVVETRNEKRGSGFCVTLCLRLSAIQFNTQ